MTTITQKAKKSVFVWVFIILAIIGVVVIAVLATLPNPDTGYPYIDLAPAALGYQSVFMWASAEIVNSLLLTVGLVCLGALGYWTIKKYFIGQKVTTTAPIYTPQGQTISQPQNQNNETVIS